MHDQNEYIRSAHKMVSDGNNVMRKRIIKDVDAIKRERQKMDYEEAKLRKYTETEMKMALEYQKAECYQVVGNLLIGHKKPKIEEALNYLANDTVHSIAEIDKMLNEL